MFGERERERESWTLNAWNLKIYLRPLKKDLQLPLMNVIQIQFEHNLHGSGWLSVGAKASVILCDIPLICPLSFKKFEKKSVGLSV